MKTIVLKQYIIPVVYKLKTWVFTQKATHKLHGREDQ